MPHAVTSTSDGKTYSYDCNGNLLTDGTRSFAWDADNKPVSILQGASATTFAYSGDGGRVKKVGGGRTIRYAGAFEDHVTDGVQVKHVFVGGLRVATRVVGGINAGIYFVHGDHLGSLNVLTNSQGTEVQRITYKPYGETFSNTGSVDFHQYRFTDQEQDPETGLYFYNARYYNPVLGRFISPDSMVPQAGNPQSLNRYSYVLNNPATLVDPSGQQFEFFSDLWDTLSSAVTAITDIVSGWFGGPAVTQSTIDPTSASIISARIGGTEALGSGTEVSTSPVAGGAISPASPALSGAGAGADQMAPTATAPSPLGPVQGSELPDDLSINPGGTGPTTSLAAAWRRGIVDCPDCLMAPEGGGGGGGAARGLGNPFSGKTPQQVDEMFRAKGFEPRGPDPATGKGGYINPETGRSYYIDPANRFGEPPHVDVNRDPSWPKQYFGPLEKRKYFFGE